MGHHTLKGVVCDRPSILGTSELKVLRALIIFDDEVFRIENKIGYYRRLKSAVFNSDIMICGIYLSP